MNDVRRSAKPWYRARNITLGLLALVAAIAGWSVFKALSAVPSPTVDYAAQVQAIALSRQPAEGADAYPTFVKILEIIQSAEQRVRNEAGEEPADLNKDGGAWPIDYSMISQSTVHPLVYQGSLAAIDYATQAGLLRELDTLAASPRAVWPKPVSPLFENMIPSLGQSRNLARMGGARMDMAAARSDWDEFARAFEHTLAVSRVCDAQGFLLSHLVSIAIDHLAVERARRIISTNAVSEAALVRILAAMDASPRAPLADAFETERLGMLDTIQNIFTDDGSGDGMLVITRFRTLAGEGGPDSFASWRIANVVGLVLPGKKATTDKCNELFTGLRNYAAAPPSARRVLPFQPDLWVEQLPRKYAPLKVLAPALSRPVQSQDQRESLWNGTRVMVAVEIYKRRHGGYPESLNALVPGILKEIPKDPFAPGGGGGYRYAIFKPGQDPAGLGYTLYSVGFDGKDDAGAGGKSEGSAYNAREPSGDYRFNAPK